MKVALYDNHHHLPFWHNSQNPVCLFPEGIGKDFTFEKSVPGTINGIDCVVRENFPASEYFMMPVLNGLLAINLPGVMAHVSLGINLEEKTIGDGKRTWIRITNQPEETDERGLPVVVKDNVVQVVWLWGSGGGTYTPFELFEKKMEGWDTPEFWTAFFLEKLHEAKEEAISEAQEQITDANKTIEAFSLVP